MNNKSIKVGVLGLGTVGAGTANVLQENQPEIQARIGSAVEVSMASVRSLESVRDCDCSVIDLRQDPFEIVAHPDIDIIAETIGGDTLAKELVLAALDNGKHVVTANKALIALHGNELFARARKNNVALCYEAAVAGGISIIKALREGMAANRIEFIAGIINGTGNFILSEMRDKGRSFDDVLGEAQALGYAEVDPTFDVEGIDAAHKLTILASLGFGIPLDFDKVVVEGISKLSLTDVTYAGEMGYHIKHLGIAKATDKGLELRVHPTLIPKKRLIANVNGVMNAVLVRGNAVGNTLHYGAGAGALPTASAMVADIVDIVRSIKGHGNQRIPYYGFQDEAIKPQKIKTAAECESAYYLRYEVRDVAGVMSKLSSIFAERDISIEAITQKEPEPGNKTVPVIFITQMTQASIVDDVNRSIEALDEVVRPVVKFPVEHLQ